MSLHVHSEYSSLDGWSTVDEIGDRIEQIGCPYCGLTDHGVVAGHIAFDKAMRSRGINPVFGCELYHGTEWGEKIPGRDQHHLLALAMTDEGLKNLWRLVNATADRARFHHVGRVTSDDIVKYKEGIMFTSACPLGLVPRGLLKGDQSWLNWYLDNLGDNFRMEVTTYPDGSDWKDFDGEGDELHYTARTINELIIDAAEEHGVPVTYGDDGHYAFPEQYEFHDMYLAAQTKQTLDTPLEERKMWHPENALCIKDEFMVRRNLDYVDPAKLDEIIANTHWVGENADAHLPAADRPHLPVFIPKECPWPVAQEFDDATELFVHLVKEGIAERYEGDVNEAWAYEKAVEELEILIDAGLDHYFLWAWDIFQFCDAEGIRTGPGRGSSAGSIVAYALGITDVDPLHYELYFGRFWNAGRAEGFPDIDSDFARSRRPEIREYLIERLGADKVCSIGTIKRFKPLATMNKLAACCGIDPGALKEVKKIVDDGVHDLEIHGTEQIGWNPEIEPGKVIYVNEDVGEEIQQWIGDDEDRWRFIRMCEHTNSRNESYGIHPSGIVISDIDLADYAPAALRGGGKKEGIPATQFPMKLIDELRLVKEDVLGLKTLDTLAEWEKLMEEKGHNIEWSGFDREEHPDEMWDLVEEGFVSGIFQIETPSGKQLAEKLKPRSLEDLGLMVALVRPGPSRSGATNRFIACRDGRREPVYAHPMLEDILSDTYGLFVYQEQIIKFMGALGYNESDADQVRKILGKKKPEACKALRYGEDEWKGKGFISVAMDKGFDEETAHAIFEEIEGFASYSFNKSHAIAYAIIAFRCLWAKYVAPEEFYIACIRTVEQNKRAELTPQYIKEARRMGIKVLPPDIRYSKGQCHVHDGHIYFGFADIKGIASSGEYIAALRDEYGLNVDTPEDFIDELEDLNTKALKEKKELELSGDLPEGWKSPKFKLNSGKIEKLIEAGAWDDILGEVSLKDKQAAEKEFLEVVVTDDCDEVIAANQDVIDACDDYADALAPLGPDDEAENFKLPGIITGVRKTKVKATGAAMGIITIEFGRHELEFACFSNKWSKAKAIFKEHQVGIFTIRHTPPTAKRAEGWHYESGRLLHV